MENAIDRYCIKSISCLGQYCNFWQHWFFHPRNMCFHLFMSSLILLISILQLISPAVRGLPQVWELSLHQSPTRGASPVPLTVLYCFPFFHPTWIRGYLSCSFRCLRSSAGVQVLSENCSMCSCTLGVLMGRGELNVLLCHPESSQVFFP